MEDWLRGVQSKLKGVELDRVMAVCWKLWNNRNNWIWDGKGWSSMDVVFSAESILQEYNSLISNLIESRTRGVGVVAWDCAGVCVGWRQKHIELPVVPEHAELLVAAEAVDLCIEKGWTRFIVEGDCLSIICRFAGDEDDDSTVGHLLSEIRFRAKEISCCSFVYVQRNSNIHAHNMARAVRETIVVEFIPP
ncbi:hypothetical protein Salat_2100900 [Sesamum alatum]|uniref:RNase H type-1 domain-containing protein n=1 Tax=Sesamum alatum TaxID=300844 RepID=A0AAE2CGN7_9LAMI|nr:hypothetical protein Salat_2100900 [Sesamum alatum]